MTIEQVKEITNQQELAQIVRTHEEMSVNI